MDQGFFGPIFYALIGSWGRAVIGWALDNPGPVGAFFATWLLLFASSNWQLSRLRSRTKELALNQAKKILEEKPDITVNQFFERLQPEWKAMVKSSAWFIPHRWELWPMPATPKIVGKRLDFTSEWLGEFLWLEQVKMRGVKPREDQPEDDPLTKLKKMARGE